MTYMYLRETRYSITLKEQKKFAKEHHIDSFDTLGPAGYGNTGCLDPAKLIGHPLEKGDELYVYNLLMLARTLPKISDEITAFHNARVKLHIVDIKYFDDVPSEGSPKSADDDYANLSAFLHIFTSANQKDNAARAGRRLKEKRPVGRPAMTWDTVSPTVRRAILRHLDHLYEYTEEDAKRDIEAAGERISITTIRKLVRDVKKRGYHGTT